MRLRPKVVNFVRLNLLNDAHKAAGIRQIAVMQAKPHVLFMGILIKMINTLGIEHRGAPLYAMHLVPLAEQELSEVRPVLTGNSRD